MGALRNPGRFFSMITLVLMGSVFLCIGVVLGSFGARGANAEADRAERLSPLSAAAIGDAQPGSEALLEGSLSARNPLRFRDFVAYIREEYRGSDSKKNAKWVEDQRVTPPLLVDVVGGSVQISNDTYRLAGPHARWEDAGGHYWNGFTGEGSKRYAGLVMGRPVMVIGQIQPGTEGPEVRAELIFGGTRAEYIADRRDTARILPIVGGILGCVGVLLLGIAAWAGLRRRVI
ncbi:MAG: hypothetical protein WCK70_10255 [Chloroflexales bacterium]|jgi:hypothetical protein